MTESKKITWKEGDKVYVGDKLVTVLTDPAGGWTQVKGAGKDPRKVRNSQVQITKKAQRVQDQADGKTKRIRTSEVYLHPKMDNYVKGLGETPSKRDTIDIDDLVAQTLRGKMLEEVYVIVSEVMVGKNVIPWKGTNDDKIDASEATAEDISNYLMEKYSNLNLGMQRMNLGNRLRGAHKVEEKRAKQAEAKAEKAKIREEAKAEKQMRSKPRRKKPRLRPKRRPIRKRPTRRLRRTKPKPMPRPRRKKRPRPNLPLRRGLLLRSSSSPV